MTIVNPLPAPYCPGCNTFAKDMDYLDPYIMEDENDEQPTPEEREEYIRQEEGTFNPANGHFLCDECYIKAGMPVAPGGWRCP